MLNKSKLLFCTAAIICISLLVPNSTFSVSFPSNCSVVEVGDPSGEPDLSKCYSVTTSDYATKVIQMAQSQLGKPYSQELRCEPSDWDSYPPPQEGRGCTYFDCSSLAGWAWYWATNKSFKMCGQTCCDFGDCQSKGGFHYNFNPEKFEKFFPTNLTSDLNRLQPGDLIYWGDKLKDGSIQTSHVAIFEGSLGKNCKGNDCMIEAWHGVEENNFSGRYNRFIGFLRPKLNYGL